MKNLLLTKLFILIILILSESSFACISSISSVYSFDTERQYLFLGKVIGYVNEPIFEGSNVKTYGLKIEVTESINLPKETADYYKVYPNGYCVIKTVKKRWLKKRYPINSLVRLSAKEDNSVLQKNKNEQLQLRTYFGNISRNDKKKRYISSKYSIFDYSSVKKGTPFIHFEFDKDLFRLTQDISQLKKTIVLERLAYAQNIRLRYKYIVEQYIKDSKTQKYLIELRKKTGYSLAHPLFEEPF